jgi:hypothetical protein
MKKAVLYLDTSSLINLKNNFCDNPAQIVNKYEVYLSLLNLFEVVAYENEIEKNQLLNFTEELKTHSLLNLPTSIITNFLFDYAANINHTCWSIESVKYPDWNESGNIFLIKNYLKDVKEHFRISNIDARYFIKKNNLNSNNPTLQNGFSYLNYIYSQKHILLGIFEDISFVQSKLVFKTQNKIDLMKSLPLICFFAPWLLGHQRLAIKTTHFSPKKNPNSIDVGHGFYMGVCDIFVTDDERLHSLLEDLNKFKYFKHYKQVRIINSNQLINSL